MDITLQYFDDCPNWKLADAHLQALKAEGLDLEVAYELIETPEAAVEAVFRGSPMVLVDGINPFPDPDAPAGVYDHGCE